MKSLELVYPTQVALADDFEQNLRKGRAFVPNRGELQEREPCELVLVHPETGARFGVSAEAVWVGPNGVGLDLIGLDAETKQALEAFVAGPAMAPGDTREMVVDRDETRTFRNVHERVRSLTPHERDTLARQGSQSERVALERAFGGSVWEALLQNPQLSPPEVARIAQNGTLPRPLVGTIVNNGGWVSNPEVQRALLSNPRCSGRELERVLRAMRPAELTRLARECPYRQEVRSQAQRLAGRHGAR